MLTLKKKYCADFYWDYESNQINDQRNPASTFIKENLMLFPSLLKMKDESLSIYNIKFTLISSPSIVSQGKLIHGVLSGIYPNENQAENIKLLETAIVLPDEKILLPVIYSIPENIKNINITMGYPLNITPIAGFFELIYELVTRMKNQKFHYIYVLNILNNQFINDLCNSRDIEKIKDEIKKLNKFQIEEEDFYDVEFLAIIFQRKINSGNFIQYLLNIASFMLKNVHLSETDRDKKKLETAFLYQYSSILKRIEHYFTRYLNDEEIKTDTIIKIIRQLTSGINIPFQGEPVDGLQVMGMLETRGLDFKNLIITSFNEGIFPKNKSNESFIPYILRKSYNLPTYEYQDAITSYNFYRLIQRTENIYFIYDCSADKGSNNEISRFYHQLKYHYQVSIEEINVNYDVQIPDFSEIIIKKDSKILTLLEKFKKGNLSALSASSINQYIQCPLQFYFSTIESVQEPDEMTDSMENSTFGSIFHEIMNLLYMPFEDKIMDEKSLISLRNDHAKIEQIIKIAYNKYFFKQTGNQITELTGNNYLISKVLFKYVQAMISEDIKKVPFQYIRGELKVNASISTKFGEINLKGFIDRIDIKEDLLYIIDYKTGGGKNEFDYIGNFFKTDLEKDKRFPHIMQTFLYSFMYSDYCDTNQKIIPQLYYIKNIFSEDFYSGISNKISKEKHIIFNDFKEEFQNNLKICLEEIFNPDIGFMQTKCVENCKFCPYKSICKR